MKTVFFKSLVVFFATSMLLTSCVDSEIDPVGYGDAYILVEIVGQDTLKGLGLHAFSYSEFSAVNVKLSDDENQTYTLQPYLGFNQDFVWSTPLNQYKKELPSAGDYIFNATFKSGHTHTFYDKLYATIVYPPTITKCEYVATNERVDVEWDRVSNADSYNVKLINENGDILFVSQVYNRMTDFYSFSKNTQGWQTSTYPTNGQTVFVEVAAYLLEAGTSNNELQSIGKARKSIVWGN
jgi:hypothetical protein